MAQIPGHKKFSPFNYSSIGTNKRETSNKKMTETRIDLLFHLVLKRNVYLVPLKYGLLHLLRGKKDGFVG